MSRHIIALIAVMLLSAACAHLGVGDFTPGVTTETDVRAKLGAPDMSWTAQERPLKPPTVRTKKKPGDDLLSHLLTRQYHRRGRA